jgi:hypothetical protein
MNSFFTWHIFLKVGKTQDVQVKFGKLFFYKGLILLYRKPLSLIQAPGTGWGHQLYNTAHLATGNIRKRPRHSQNRKKGKEQTGGLYKSSKGHRLDQRNTVQASSLLSHTPLT